MFSLELRKLKADLTFPIPTRRSLTRQRQATLTEAKAEERKIKYKPNKEVLI